LLSCAKREHYDECVKYYKEITNVVRKEKITTTITEKSVTRRLTKVFVQIITSGCSSTTVTAGSIEAIIEMCIQTYRDTKIQYGCWHPKTLGRLHDIVIISHKHGGKKSHPHMLSLLKESFIAIVTSVLVPIKLHEAACILASIYIEVGLVQQAHELLRQARHLILFHDIHTTEIDWKLDVKVTKIAFVFLVTFEQRLHENIAVTFSEVMADILLESIYYEKYTETIRVQAEIKIILESAAKLRCYWVKRGRTDLIIVLDTKIFALFKVKYGQFVKMHDDRIRDFYVALLIELGKERATMDFPTIACLAGNNRVKALLEKGCFKEAKEVAECAFEFAKSQGYYASIKNMDEGYKLAELVAGIDVRKTSDQKLYLSMLNTSRKITAEVLAKFRAASLRVTRMRPEDINGLVSLLATQQNWCELVVSS
jgi:hypothetical protein